MFVYIFISVCKTGVSVEAHSILASQQQHFRVCPQQWQTTPKGRYLIRSSAHCLTTARYTHRQTQTHTPASKHLHTILISSTKEALCVRVHAIYSSNNSIVRYFVWFYWLVLVTVKGCLGVED